MSRPACHVRFHFSSALTFVICFWGQESGNGGSDGSDEEEHAPKPKGKGGAKPQEEDDEASDESGHGKGGRGQAMEQGEEGDEMLECRDCNAQFAFTVGEQEFFKQKGFDNKPTRCADCKVLPARLISTCMLV